MKGLYTLATPFAARTILAGAALLAGATFTPVRAQNARPPSEEIAFVFSPLPTQEGGAARLPHPLSAEDVQHIKKVLLLQKENKFNEAKAESQFIKTDLLNGYIQADRYLNPYFKANAGQLRAWIKNYADYPQATEIYAAYTKLNPKDSHLPAPSINFLKENVSSFLSENDNANQISTLKRNPLLDKTIRERANLGEKGVKSALHLIKNTPGMNGLYAAQLQAEIAQIVFCKNESLLAFKLAQSAFQDSQQKIGLAGYIAGLSAWKRQRPDQAIEFFETAAHADVTTENIRSASAFWAARSHQHIGDLNAYRDWLKQAALHHQTFYGLLAQYILTGNAQHTLLAGQKSVPTEIIATVDIEAVNNIPAGQRFFALLQIGENAHAEETLRYLWPQIQHDHALCRSVQLVAEAAGLHTLSEQIRSILSSQSNYLLKDIQKPLPHLTPHRGYKMNPALVYALTRIESNFDSTALSAAGAHGLMQITPVTLKAIAQHSNLISSTPAASALLNPSLNLEFGQLYLLYLAQLSSVHHEDVKGAQGDSPINDNGGGDLIRMLGSYNAGPAALAHWNDVINENEDPLLFIESLPVQETREYIQKVFTYLWIYSTKLALPIPSLQALAKNEWPAFEPEQALASHPFYLAKSSKTIH